MRRYLVEVSQQLNARAEERIDNSVRTLGSHFVTHADWHRREEACTATMIVEAGDIWGALGIVPPSMRSGARIYELEAVGSMSN